MMNEVYIEIALYLMIHIFVFQIIMSSKGNKGKKAALPKSAMDDQKAKVEAFYASLAKGQEGENPDERYFPIAIVGVGK